MLTWLHQFLNTFWHHHDTLNFFLSYGLVIVAIGVIAFGSDFLAQRYLVRLLDHLLSRTDTHWSEAIRKNRIIAKIAHLAPALVFYVFSNSLRRSDYPVTETIVGFLQTVVVLYVILKVFQAMSGILSAAEMMYNLRPIARKRPIKSYVQVAKIVLALFALVFSISALLDESPIVFLTSLGAATAVIVLVFRDSILGFVASIQLASYDMVRIGDWIEMPSFGADGDVIEVSLGTVKVRNFDKTITTIPTYALLSNGLKNWRGMSESGGRRIKRVFKIDLRSLRFCDETVLSKLRSAPFFSGILEKIVEDLKQDDVEQGRETNIGLLRRYLVEYCRAHPQIHTNGFTLMVRELEATETGLPVQLYIFTTDTRWVEHEEIQAEIFDHVFCALPFFSLAPYQRSAAS